MAIALFEVQVGEKQMSILAAEAKSQMLHELMCSPAFWGCGAPGTPSQTQPLSWTSRGQQLHGP